MSSDVWPALSCARQVVAAFMIGVFVGDRLGCTVDLVETFYWLELVVSDRKLASALIIKLYIIALMFR